MSVEHKARAKKPPATYKKNSVQKESCKRGIKRDKLNGTNGFLRKSALSCSFLRKSAPPKCCHSQEKRKSAKISENLRKTANSARFVPFSLSLLIPLEKSSFTNKFWGVGAALRRVSTVANPTSGIKMTGVSKTSLLIFVVFAH